MTTTGKTVVVGVFEDRTQAAQALQELRSIGFGDDQIGFTTRYDDALPTETSPEAAETTETQTTAAEGVASERPGSIMRGIAGGVLGAIDMLLVPVTGPADASAILGSVLPVAEEAIDRLPYPGSSNDATAPTTRPDAPMTMPTSSSSSAEISSTAANSSSIDEQSQETPPPEVDSREGIVAGGITGGVLGAAAAFLIPGIGPAIAGGILAAIFGGAAIGGAAGGFLGMFAHLGIPTAHARQYEQEFLAGRTLVTVHTEERQQKATEILQRYGALDVQTH